MTRKKLQKKKSVISLCNVDYRLKRSGPKQEIVVCVWSSQHFNDVDLQKNLLELLLSEPKMDSRNRLLHLLVFYYNGAHHGIAVCLNVMALAVLGASWRKIGKLQDVRLPYFMSIFICGLNIIFLISVELPKLYSEWTEEPNLFSVRVCLYLSVAVPISEVAQTIVIMWAIVGISHRQRLVSRFSSNLGGK